MAPAQRLLRHTKHNTIQPSECEPSGPHPPHSGPIRQSQLLTSHDATATALARLESAANGTIAARRCKSQERAGAPFGPRSVAVLTLAVDCRKNCGHRRRKE